MGKVDYDKDTYLELSDGREALVTYFVEDYGSEPSGMFGLPEHYDPGSGAVICIGPVFVDEDEVEVSEAEQERLADMIAANPDWWMPDPHDYYD